MRRDGAGLRRNLRRYALAAAELTERFVRALNEAREGLVTKLVER